MVLAVLVVVHVIMVVDVELEGMCLPMMEV